jgi:hypothetical protein
MRSRSLRCAAFPVEEILGKLVNRKSGGPIKRSHSGRTKPSDKLAHLDDYHLVPQANPHRPTPPENWLRFAELHIWGHPRVASDGAENGTSRRGTLIEHGCGAVSQPHYVKEQQRSTRFPSPLRQSRAAGSGATQRRRRPVSASRAGASERKTTTAPNIHHRIATAQLIPTAGRKKEKGVAAHRRLSP